MRRATLLLFASIAAMLLATGVAVAATFTGSDDVKDVLNGTANSDTLSGKGLEDYLNGKGGNDFLYGGPGSDNFKTIVGKDSLGTDLAAGLRGAGGDDKIYGDDQKQQEPGDDDLIGNAGNDTLDDKNQKGDWDRAFGGTGNDTVNFVDGDFEDEVSCGENTTSETPTDGDTDTVYIDVIVNSNGNITSADTVHEFDSNKKSIFCEVIKAKDQNGKVRTVTYEDLELVTGETVAAVEPTA